MDLVYFALLCSVLIFVHELGHFVWAKIFGVKVLTFSIGFGPKIVRIRGRETEYCIGILPLGGFVKMLEETRQESVLPEDKARTFEAQALYKRVIIVLAGPAMNVLFPVLLYFSVLVGEQSGAPPTIGFVSPGHPADGKLLPGDRVLDVDGDPVYTFAELTRVIQKSPNKELTMTVFRGRERVEVSVTPQEHRVEKPLEIVDTIGEIGIGPSQPAAVIGVTRPDSPAYRAGLRTFDVVIEVRGRPVKKFVELEQALADNRGETVPVAFLRPVKVSGALGAMADVAVYESGVAALTPDAAQGTLTQRTGIEPADLFVFDVPEGSAEAQADLREGDRITAVDNVEVPAWVTFQERLFAEPDRPHTIMFERQGQKKSGVIRLRRELYIDEYGGERPRYVLRARNWAPVVPEAPVESPRRYQAAFVGAVEETYDVTRFIVVGIVRIVEGKVSLSTLGGPITVYDVVGEQSQKGVTYFVWAMAVISINLGLINLLPIPILDGGHLLFFLFEGLLRRPLPLRVREIASLVGMVLLFGLMGVAFKNDVERRWEIIQGQVKELWP
ncbi:MAG TPA: RIP metalloprotease RseP [Polyangiaceae bacterium]|nr:RIP metalloprotease RseP [Polyangiaceae bacterium]